MTHLEWDDSLRFILRSLGALELKILVRFSRVYEARPHLFVRWRGCRGARSCSATLLEPLAGPGQNLLALLAQRTGPDGLIDDL